MTLTFRYEARGPSGRLERGTLAASSSAEALDRLKRRNLTPFALRQAAESAGAAARLDDRAAHDLSRALAQLINAGLSFGQALRFASEELGPNAAEAASRMREAAERGEPASTALGEIPGAEARLLRGVVAAGEASGRLAEALDVAAASFSRSAEMRGRMGAALIYPCFVVLATLATLLCFLLLVVPTMGQAFSGAEERLPESTRALLQLSGWLKANGALSLIAIGALTALTLSSAAAKASIMRAVDRVLVSPVGLGVAARLDFAAFASLSALALKAGVPTATAFDSAAQAVRNSVVRARILRAVAQIRIGERPSHAFDRFTGAPKSFLRLLHLGEETGALGQTLAQASALLSGEAERRLERLGAIAGPVVTLLLGLLVAGVVMSLFLGLLSMSELATA